MVHANWALCRRGVCFYASETNRGIAMPYADSGGTAIYYEVEGDEAGTGLLFAHGAGGNAGIWYQQVEYFVGLGYRCVTFDHRTFARTPADPATCHPQQFRDDALAVLDAAGVARAHVVGQSMGGFTVLRLALDAPERVLSLTMSATPGGLPNDNPTPAVRGLLSSTGSGGDGVIATMSRATLQDPLKVRLYRVINGFNTQFSFANLGALGGYVVSFDEAQALGCPVLFIAGAEDPLFPASLLQSYVPHLPNAACEVVTDAGHSPYFEQPEMFNALLNAHMRATEP